MPQVMSMKAEYLVLLSFFMTFAVVTNAFYTKKQFYPSVVYLTKSSTSLAVNWKFSAEFLSMIYFRYSMFKHLYLLFYLVNLCKEYSLDNFEQLKLRFVDERLGK